MAEKLDAERPADAEVDKKEIEQLIEALASTNPVPKRRGEAGGYYVVYAPDYKADAQDIVYRAGDELIAKGPHAFPLLLAHLRDDRFSYVTESPAGLTPVSVGDACQSIFECQLEVYESVFTHGMPHYFLEVVCNSDVTEDHWNNWWKSHRNKSLLNLQIEAVEWSISEFERMLLDSERLTDSDDGLDETTVREVLAKNRELLRRLREMRMPVTPKRSFPRVLR